VTATLGDRRPRPPWAHRRRGVRPRLAGCLLALGCCTAAPAGPAAIGFDLEALDAQGLIGPPGGKRAVNYEYCIPAGKRFADEVRTIDPGARYMPGARGRIGCAGGQVLVLGSTHRPDYAQVLRRLAALPYVRRIEQAFFE